MSRTTSTPEQRAERLAELHEQITDGVAALVDPDAWRAMLDTAAKFHTTAWATSC